MYNLCLLWILKVHLLNVYIQCLLSGKTFDWIRIHHRDIKVTLSTCKQTDCLLLIGGFNCSVSVTIQDRLGVSFPIIDTLLSLHYGYLAYPGVHYLVIAPPNRGDSHYNQCHLKGHSSCI